nr:uncharacterized protein LOC112704031 [Arachis hypogaea]
MGRRIIVVGDLNIVSSAIDRCDAGPEFDNNEFRRWFRSILTQYKRAKPESILSWVSNGVVGSPAFAAYDKGYDVFLENFRGLVSREYRNKNISSRHSFVAVTRSIMILRLFSSIHRMMPSGICSV